MRRPIVNNSVAGEPIYEPFCGSGTTIIACHAGGSKFEAGLPKPLFDTRLEGLA